MFNLLKQLTKWQWVALFLVMALIAGQVYFDLSLPDEMGKIVSLIQKGATVKEIWMVGLIMLGIVVGSVACTIIASFLAARIAVGLSKTIRAKMFEKVGSFSMEEINKFSTSSLITRSTNDVTQIQNVLIMVLRMALSAPAMAIGAIIKIVGKSGTLSLTTAAAIVLMLCMTLFMFIVVIPKFTVIQKRTDRLNQVTRENLTGLKVIRAYSAEDYQNKKFDNANDELTKTNLFVNRISGIIHPYMMLIMSGLSLSIIWISAVIVNTNPEFIASMTIFTQYAMQVLFSFVMLAMLFIMVPRGMVSAKRINEVLNTKSNIVSGEKKNTKNKFGEIEFKNVKFKYPDATGDVLQDITFKINKGETVAFVGSTGSGKSTLINLIPRFYDATEGEILINGQNVKDYKLEELNDLLGYVPQKSILFSGSIKENLKYGKADANDEEIAKALKIAQAEDFVNSLAEKTDYVLAQGGKNVSGGQKQRLAIARAIIKSPEFFIFDDSFSALDYKTDKALRKALKKEVKDATKIIVAQRVGTIMDADNIIVLDKGKIVGIGTHKELLKNCNVYKEIAYSQLSKEELK